MQYHFESRANKINSNKCTSIGHTTGNFHYHDQYELFYLLSGSRNYLRDSQLFRLEQNCVTLTKPHVIHATTGNDYSRVCIHFSKDFLLDYFTEAHTEYLLTCFSEDWLPQQKIIKNIQIKELFIQLDQYIQEENYALSAHILGRLLLELCSAIKNPLLPESTNYPKTIIVLCDYIKDNLSNIKNLADICNHFYFSKFYISHLFKKTTGITLTEYLIECRLNQAMLLLRTTDKTISEIAQECGYGEPAYFCLTFKKKLKITPTAYRKQFKKLRSKKPRSK